MKSIKPIKAFSLIELSITVLIIGVVTIVALNGKSLVIKANCVVSSLGSKTITDNLNNPSALTRNRSTAYDTCVSSGGIISAAVPDINCSGLACTSCKTLLTSNPGITSGTYTIDPDGTGAIAQFNVYCDMTDSGGWTKILHYKDAAYTPNTGAVNPTGISTESTAAISGFAKLSDAQINAIGGSGVTKTYRISGDKTTNKYYTKSNGVWNDTARGFGLAAVSRQSCRGQTISNCTWYNNSVSWIDTFHEGISPQVDDCDRFFSDHNSTINCYKTGSSTMRCFTGGGSCPGSYPIFNNLEVYLRE